MTESALHRAVAQYLSAVLLPPAWFTTFPAGGGGKVRGGQLKARGLRAGVPDILIVYEGIARFIELKSDKGRLSPEQKQCHDMLRAAGAWVSVCRSLDHVELALRAWEIPTRVAKGAA